MSVKNNPVNSLLPMQNHTFIDDVFGRHCHNRRSPHKYMFGKVHSVLPCLSLFRCCIASTVTDFTQCVLTVHCTQCVLTVHFTQCVLTVHCTQCVLSVHFLVSFPLCMFVLVAFVCMRVCILMQTQMCTVLHAMSYLRKVMPEVKCNHHDGMSVYVNVAKETR